MVRFPFVRSEWEVFACSEVAAITTAGRLAAAATPALPIRNRRRDGEGGAVGGIAEMLGLVSGMVDIVDLLTNKATIWSGHFLSSVSDERAPVAIRGIVDISSGAATVVSFALRFGERPAVPEPRNQIGVGDERLTKGGEVDRARSDQFVCFRQSLAAGQDQRTLVERRPQFVQQAVHLVADLSGHRAVSGLVHEMHVSD